MSNDTITVLGFWIAVVSAVIAVGAILVQIWVHHREQQEAKKRDELQAKGIALLIYLKMDSLVDQLERSANSHLYMSNVTLPRSVEQSLDRLFLLGDTGEAILSVVSIVRSVFLPRQDLIPVSADKVERMREAYQTAGTAFDGLRQYVDQA